MASNSRENVFHFHISLTYLKPKIRRRIQVPANYTFQQLHWAIQDCMGWKNNNFNRGLHDFRMTDPVSGEEIVIGDGDDFIGTVSGKCARLKDFFIAPKMKALYEYDFGVGWKHSILLEKFLPLESTECPICIGGKRACTNEDCCSYDKDALDLLTAIACWLRS